MAWQFTTRRFIHYEACRRQSIHTAGTGDHHLAFRQFQPLATKATLEFITQPHIINPMTDNKLIAQVCDIDLSVNNFTMQLFDVKGKSWDRSGYYSDRIIFGDQSNSYEKSSHFENQYYGMVSLTPPKNDISHKLK